MQVNLPMKHKQTNRYSKQIYSYQREKEERDKLGVRH